MGLLDKHTVDRVRQEGELCPKCNKGVLEAKKGKYGKFLGCGRWPDCSHTESAGVNLNKLALDLLKFKNKHKKTRRGKKKYVKVNGKKVLKKKYNTKWKKKVEEAMIKHKEEKKARQQLHEHISRAEQLMK
jgi:ssDNA-binding Zn-finger/Zn-ribbon topoisomerase 1